MLMGHIQLFAVFRYSMILDEPLARGTFTDLNAHVTYVKRTFTLRYIWGMSHKAGKRQSLEAVSWKGFRNDPNIKQT